MIRFLELRDLGSKPTPTGQTNAWRISPRPHYFTTKLSALVARPLPVLEVARPFLLAHLPSLLLHHQHQPQPHRFGSTMTRERHERSCSPLDPKQALDDSSYGSGKMPPPTHYPHPHPYPIPRPKPRPRPRTLPPPPSLPSRALPRLRFLHLAAPIKPPRGLAPVHSLPVIRHKAASHISKLSSPCFLEVHAVDRLVHSCSPPASATITRSHRTNSPDPLNSQRWDRSRGLRAGTP